jgi:ABC-2 type transport system permease protein
MMLRSIFSFFALARISFKESISYAIEVWGKLFFMILSYMVWYYLWNAIYNGRQEIAGMTLAATLTHLTISVFVDASVKNGPMKFVGEAILTGDIGKELIRPVSFQTLCMAQAAGKTVSDIIIESFPLLLFGVFFIGIVLPGSSFYLPFICSVFLAFLVYFYIEYSIAQAVIFIQTYFAIRNMFMLFLSYTSGAVIPFPFMPESIRFFLFSLPFHCIYATPINIFLKCKLVVSPYAKFIASYGIPLQYALIVEQFGWLVILFTFGNILWKYTSKKIMIQGG